MRKPCIEREKYFLPKAKETLCVDCRKETLANLNKGKENDKRANKTS
jgi:hypothetical protein